MCRAELKDEACLISPANECGDEAAGEEMDLTQTSSKLESKREILGATKAKGKKTIIFSQWTRFLDFVQARLDRDSCDYYRVDGTMSARQRDGALQALEHDANCTVMLASLGVCALGLNLTTANQIIPSDTWWPPAMEDQAVDRVHRLGQETRVFRLVMDKSIEEQTLEVQKRRRKLMMLAFSERGERETRRKLQVWRIFRSCCLEAMVAAALMVMLAGLKRARRAMLAAAVTAAEAVVVGPRRKEEEGGIETDHLLCSRCAGQDTLAEN